MRYAVAFIRKDIMYLRKQLIIALCSIVGFMIFGVLFCGSYKYGNLAKLPESNFNDTYMTATSLFGVLPGVLCLLSLGVIFWGTVSADRRNGWYIFTSTLPVGKRLIAVTKLGEISAVFVASAAVGVIGIISCYTVSGRDIAVNDIFIMADVLLFLLIFMLLPTFYLFKGRETASFFTFFLMYITADVATAVIMLSMRSGMDPEKAMTFLQDNAAVISLILVAINIAVFAVSAAVSAKILGKDVR